MRTTLNYLLFLAIAMLLSGCGGGSSDISGALSGPINRASTETPCSAYSDTRLHSMSDQGISLTSPLGLAAGRYAVPANPAPTQLVVMFHGSHNDSCSWREHLRRTAVDHGAVAFAMDYTGQRTEGDIEKYGWFMRAGAADSIEATKYFLARYPSITQVFVMGVSMGGNASGVALASPDAVNADGSPLFDYWVAVEGVHNLTELYLIARAIAPGVEAGAVAQREMEEENGGTLEQAPERYAEITNVLHAPEMAYLKGAVLVHGVDDGLVPTWQSREMFMALNFVGVPSHMYTVGGTGSGTDGTTATGLILGEDFDSPLAGHGWEGDYEHLVIRTGFDQLYLMMGGATDITPGETPVPGF